MQCRAIAGKYGDKSFKRRNGGLSGNGLVSGPVNWCSLFVCCSNVSLFKAHIKTYIGVANYRNQHKFNGLKIKLHISKTKIFFDMLNYK